jgi:histidine triad (HIT) family protein
MTISKDQAEQIKKQLIQQIERTLPEGQREAIVSQIESFNEEQLEQFLKQNNIKLSEKPSSEKTVFEQIVTGELPSYKIDENSKSIAILELNPLSKGHSLILPKQKLTIEKIPKSALSLSQKIAKKIKKKLKPEDIKIETSSFQDYAFINVIPIYKESKLEKRKAEEAELSELQKKLEQKKRGKRIKTPKKKDNLPEILPRIP